MKKFLYAALPLLFILFLTACSDSDPSEDDSYDSDEDTSYDTSDDNDYYDGKGDYDVEDDSDSESPYTREELENDPLAPSTDPEDYDSNGQYVPKGGPSDNPADYNAKGEYKPFEDMTQEEMLEEMEDMLEKSTGENFDID